MSQPNRIVIAMDGGTTEVYGDFFADMLNCYTNRLFDRQKEAQASLHNINIGDHNRQSRFNQAAAEWKDAELRISILKQVEKVFKNGSTHGGTRTVTPVSYVQPGKD